jgi:hypothetical protein
VKTSQTSDLFLFLPELEAETRLAELEEEADREEEEVELEEETELEEEAELEAKALPEQRTVEAGEGAELVDEEAELDENREPELIAAFANRIGAKSESAFLATSFTREVFSKKKLISKQPHGLELGSFSRESNMLRLLRVRVFLNFSLSNYPRVRVFLNFSLSYYPRVRVVRKPDPWQPCLALVTISFPFQKKNTKRVLLRRSFSTPNVKPSKTLGVCLVQSWERLCCIEERKFKTFQSRFSENISCTARTLYL